MMGTSHVQWTPPERYTARPGRYTNTGRRDVTLQHKFQRSLVLLSVHQQSGCSSSCYTETGMHSAVVLKTVEIPQLQFLDLVVVPVLCNDKYWYRQCRKQWNCRRCSSCGVVDVAVILQRLFQSKSSVSCAIQFPRQSAGHSSCATAVLEQGC